MFHPFNDPRDNLLTVSAVLDPMFETQGNFDYESCIHDRLRDELGKVLWNRTEVQEEPTVELSGELTSWHKWQNPYMDLTEEERPHSPTVIRAQVVVHRPQEYRDLMRYLSQLETSNSVLQEQLKHRQEPDNSREEERQEKIKKSQRRGKRRRV